MARGLSKGHINGTWCPYCEEVGCITYIDAPFWLECGVELCTICGKCFWLINNEVVEAPQPPDTGEPYIPEDLKKALENLGYKRR